MRGCGHLLRDGGGTENNVPFFLTSSADQWVAANKELVDRNQFKVKDLPVGEKMLFRVVAVNIAGRSPPASLTHPVTIREIVGQSAVTTSCFVFFPPSGPKTKTSCSVRPTSQSTQRSASPDT